MSSFYSRSGIPIDKEFYGTKVSGPAVPASALPPKPAGVRKLIPRAKPVANTKTAARSTTRDYELQAAVALKEEASEESDEYLRPIRRRVTKGKTIVTCPPKSDVHDDSDGFLQHRANRPKTLDSPSPILKRSVLPAPAVPANTESEIENLMTIGRKKVEKQLRDRINEEKEKKLLLKKQTTTFENYKTYLAKLKDLEEELAKLKMENHLNEDTVSDIAEDFRESTMEWAKLFEKYAGDLGISVFDIRRLADAW